jgi:hypothetical protein
VVIALEHEVSWKRGERWKLKPAGLCLETGEIKNGTFSFSPLKVAFNTVFVKIKE